jgi:hypothetical protein
LAVNANYTSQIFAFLLQGPESTNLRSRTYNGLFPTQLPLYLQACSAGTLRVLFLVVHMCTFQLFRLLQLELVAQQDSQLKPSQYTHSYPMSAGGARMPSTLQDWPNRITTHTQQHSRHIQESSMPDGLAGSSGAAAAAARLEHKGLCCFRQIR